MGHTTTERTHAARRHRGVAGPIAPRRRRAAVPLVAVALLGACGGGSGSQGTRSHPPVPGAPTIPVTGNNLRFDPSHITVKAGQSFNVAFTAKDIFHTFVIQGGSGELDSNPASTATSGGFHLTRAGTYAFYCSVPVAWPGLVGWASGGRSTRRYEPTSLGVPSPTGGAVGVGCRCGAAPCRARRARDGTDRRAALVRTGAGVLWITLGAVACLGAPTSSSHV
jgi:plastocyanin